MEQSHAIGSQMRKGAAWMVLFKLLDRAIALLSVIALARLLVPEDFGLIALAVSTIAMLEVIGAFGLETALIQRLEARREHFDAVWTFNVLFGLATAAVTAMIALPAAAFYGDPRVATIMWFLAIGRVIHGTENVGIVAFRKELEFDREFRFLLFKRLAAAVTTIALAFALRNYWALLIGSLVGGFIAVVLSFAMHPFRPRPSLRGLGELMQFSKWLYFANVVDELHSRLADMIVGRIAGMTALGLLAIARDVARLPRELSAPVHRAVFPGFVKLAGDREQLRRAYLKLASALMLVILPGGVGLALVAEPVVAVLLGDRWDGSVPLVRILAINGILVVLLASAHYVNVAVGMARSTSVVLAVDLALTLPLMLWLVPLRGAEGAAWSVLIASVLTLPLNGYLLTKAIRFGWREVVTILFRPVCASVVMGAVVIAIASAWPWPASLSGQVAYLVIVAGAGAAAYATTLYTAWRRRPDPDSAEDWLMQRIEAVGRNAKGRLRTRLP